MTNKDHRASNAPAHSSLVSGTNVDALIPEFSSEDGAARERARRAVVKLGPAAIGGLVNALNHPNVRIRWEATKALCELRDPAAAAALVGRLEGTDSGVRWMAADGLIAMGPIVLEPVLQVLIQRSDSILLREGAHRVLHGLAGQGGLQPILQPVLDAMASIEPAVVVPLAAYNALNALRERPQSEGQVITIRRVRVRDWMSTALVTVKPTETLSEVFHVMNEHKIRHVLIVAQNQLAGIVSLGDVREALASDLVAATATKGHKPASLVAVDQIMAHTVRSISPDATLREAARMMLEHKIGALPVMDGASLAGIITESDIFRVLIQENSAME